MNEQYTQLYQRIQNFSLDDCPDKSSFSQRLARENCWSLDYAERAIAEYKKFAFLAVVTEHPVTPSKPIDRVWHQHLLHTRSYWDEFCPHVLQTPFHHRPSLGGDREQSQFQSQYQQTLDSYKLFFGKMPPADIWNSLETPSLKLQWRSHLWRVFSSFPKLRQTIAKCLANAEPMASCDCGSCGGYSVSIE